MTMTMRMRFMVIGGFALLVIITGQSGCAVPQPPGHGTCERLVEPTTDTRYWLYLPEDYAATNGRHPDGGRWPLVVTLHGLKPYDNANPQVRSWQEEADRYGFIVLAPELRTCDSLTMQYPLRDPSLPYVQKDEKAIMAIMDEVFLRTNADPLRVLATSFSSGGYLAHYLVNRYPERFCCLAVRGSNFNEQMLSTAQVPKYRDMKIGIFFGENDFADCRRESVRALEWYQRYRFDVQAKKVAGLGHQRRPQTAAAFFAEAIGVEPKTPPELGALVLKDVVPEGQSRPRPTGRPAPGSPPTGSASRMGSGSLSRSATGNVIFSEPRPEPAVAQERTPTQVSPTAPPPRAGTPVTGRSNRSRTPKRPPGQPYSARGPAGPQTALPAAAVPVPARIRVQGQNGGPPPVWLNLQLEMPAELQDGASVLWLDNGRPVGTSAFESQAVLWEPGEHTIEAWVALSDHRRAVLRETVTVRPFASSRPAAP